MTERKGWKCHQHAICSRVGYRNLTAGLQWNGWRGYMLDRSQLPCFHDAVSQTMRTFNPPEVGKLPDHCKNKGNVCLLEPWWCVQWMVEEVSNKCSKAPVVCAVFEEIPQRHSAMTEPADRSSPSIIGMGSLSAQGLHLSKLNCACQICSC